MELKKDKPVRLKGSALAALRRECYVRDGGKCVECGRKLYLENGGWWNAHMAHIIGRGRGGGDTLDNVRILCIEDHIGKEHNANGKPCPPKPQRAEDGSWVN